MDAIHALAAQLRRARHVLVLTGAGVSAVSGSPAAMAVPGAPTPMAVSISGPITRVDDSLAERAIPALPDATRTIAQALTGTQD